MKKKQYNSLEQPLRFVPESLAKLKIECPHCKTSFIPDWLSKRHPIEPVKSKVSEGSWIPTSVFVHCSLCENKIDFKLPIHKADSTYRFYGDEAYRDVQDKYLIVYTLVGNNQNNIDEILLEVEKLKQSLLPDIPSISWSIHMKEMWSERKKSKLFKHLTHEQVVDFSKKLCDIIKKSDKGFTVYNTSAVYYKPKNKKQKQSIFKEVRHESYSMLLSKVINDSTVQNIIPSLYFDATGKDGWAKDIFLGSKLSLLYPFLTNGITVPEPKFVEPASHGYLELADFISFIVARYLHEKLLGKETVVDPELMGDIFYLGFNVKGDFKYEYRSGYPWKEFFE